MTKRLREESGEEEMESTTAATLLLIRSLGIGMAKTNGREASPSGRRFACKMCNRHFRSFQALGGHCTSHKRARISKLADPFDEMQRAKSEPRIHKCTICGLTFDMGQALGGHMRRHKGLFKSRRQLHEKTSAAKEMFMDMDSNTPRLLDLFV